MKRTVRRICILLLILSVLSLSAVPSAAPADVSLRMPVTVPGAAAQLPAAGPSAAGILFGSACSRAEAATMLWILDCRPHFGADPGYADLDTEAFYYRAVCWAADLGLFPTADPTRYSPEAPCTRGEVITGIWIYAGRPESGMEISVPGAAEDSDTAAAVRWAAECGIADELPGGALLTEAPCSRLQLLSMLGKLKGMLPEKRLVVIDPGHQRHANYEKEANGPGSSVMKAKVASGTYGKTSGLYEYELNLTVSFRLREELERRGYRVLMTRESHDVNISNIQRAQFANNAGADIAVRIHANGSDNAAVYGAETICMTRSSPYNSNLYTKSRALSDAIINHLCEQTGARNKGVWETDTMTGINWSTVPVTIVEMGYMSNAAEDSSMATASYQAKIVQGICDGIDEYFANYG